MTTRGRVEFLYDMDAKEWFFIQMNPRIQVERAVTERITRTDLVRSPKFFIAEGFPIHGKEIDLPARESIPAEWLCGAVPDQPVRIPRATLRPTTGRVANYRSAAGFGMRLDAGTGDAGV